MTSKAIVNSLIKTHEDVTPNTGREMNFSLQVELDTDGQCGSLQVAVVVDGTLEEVTNGAVGRSGEAGEREAVADLSLHLAVLHGQVEPTWLVGVLAGVGADDAGPLGLGAAGGRHFLWSWCYSSFGSWCGGGSRWLLPGRLWGLSW